MERGESIERAAVREVAEETGIRICCQDLTHMAFAEGEGTLGDLVGPMRDDVFAAQTPTTAIVTDGMEAHELSGLDRFRWWRPPDLHETKEPVFPLRLASTLIDFVAAEEWPEPVMLPW